MAVIRRLLRGHQLRNPLEEPRPAGDPADDLRGLCLAQFERGLQLRGDPRMVAIARRRLSARGAQVRLSVGDALDIDASDGSYDAVFDFGIIHHVSKWQQVLAEANRVLLPGGLFFAEEPVG